MSLERDWEVFDAGGELTEALADYLFGTDDREASFEQRFRHAVRSGGIAEALYQVGYQDGLADAATEYEQTLTSAKVQHETEQALHAAALKRLRSLTRKQGTPRKRTAADTYAATLTGQD